MNFELTYDTKDSMLGHLYSADTSFCNAVLEDENRTTGEYGNFCFVKYDAFLLCRTCCDYNDACRDYFLLLQNLENDRHLWRYLCHMYHIYSLAVTHH